MNRKLVASTSLTLFVLAGCSRSCVSEAPHYGSYASAFPAPTWAPARYHATSTFQSRDEVRIDAHRLGFVIEGQRVTLTDRTAFRIVPSAEKLSTFYPLPDDKGFLFVTDEAIHRTFFAERFDGPLRLIGIGKPCHSVASVGVLPLGTCAQIGGHVSMRNDKAFPTTDDLVVLIDESTPQSRMVSLPNGEAPPKSTPRAETLLTMDTGLAFLRGPEGLFARAPGETTWKRIGSNTVSTLSSDESGTVIAYGSEGPTRIVEGTYAFDGSRRTTLGPTLVPATNTRGELPEGRFDRETWTLSASHALGMNPGDCRVVGPMHDLLACTWTQTFIMHADDENPARDRVFRVLSPKEELPDAGLQDLSAVPGSFGGFSGVLANEPTPIRELEGIPGMLKGLVSNEFGTLIQDTECEGATKRFAVCLRNPTTLSWKTATLSPGLSTIAETARVHLFPAPHDEVFVFAAEPDGSLTIGLGRSGRLRRFPKDELPWAIGKHFAASEVDAASPDASNAEPHLPKSHPRKMESESETPPQFLVTEQNRFRVVGVRAEGKSYSIELGFDGQPDLDSFDGYVSFAGPYGLGLHDSGGLFESLDGGHSFLRVPSPPLPGKRASDADADADAGARDLSRVLRCYPAGCVVGGFERRGYGTVPRPGAGDAGRDGR